MSSRKRKYSSSGPPASLQTNTTSSSQTSPTGSDYNLYIQAYEADLIRGPAARLAAQSLEVTRLQVDAQDTREAPRWKIGEGLIKWDDEKLMRSRGKSASTLTGFIKDDEDDLWINDEKRSVWVDRYASSENFKPFGYDFTAGMMRVKKIPTNQRDLEIMFPSKLQAIYSQKALSFISTSFWIYDPD
jgi:hypothetical protein